MNDSKKTVVEYINKNNQKVQVVVNTDSLIEARRQVEARGDVKQILHTKIATPMDKL